jgi:hypothetical protein
MLINLLVIIGPKFNIIDKTICSFNKRIFTLTMNKMGVSKMKCLLDPKVAHYNLEKFHSRA